MIVHVHTGHEWGGGEQQILHLLAGFRRADVPCVLLADPHGPLATRCHAAGLDVRSLPRFWRLPLAVRPVARELAAAGAELLHCHDSGALDLGHRLRRTLRVPLVLSRRVASPLRPNRWSRAKYAPDRLDAVVAVSHTVRDVFCHSGFPLDRVTVVPSGTDVHALLSVEAAAEVRERWPVGPVVAGIGKLAPRKNWEFLIRVAARFAREDSACHWLLVGDGPDAARLRQLVDAEGLGDRIHFTGFRADADALLRASDVLFFPSIREGAPGVVRHAMVLGIPVVAVDAAGTKEVLDNHGWLVADGDVEGAVRALTDVLTDGSRVAAVTGAARDSVSVRFPLERTVRQTLAVYETLTAGRLSSSTRSART